MAKTNRVVIQSGDQIEVHVGEWMKIQAVVPGDVWQMFDRAVGQIEKEAGHLHDNELVRNGMVLEYLLAEFFASPRPRS